MSIIDFEIEEIKKICENVLQKSKIVVCSPLLVRVDIASPVQLHCQITVCLRFPDEYPKLPILIELKSRTLANRFLDGLTNLCESKVREQLGKPQIIYVLSFVQKYLQENPLCVCVDEIHQLRRELGADASADQLKLKQRSSSVNLHIKNGAYYYRVRATVPPMYPQHCVDLMLLESNLPAVLVRFLNGQSNELARQCVEPPLALAKNKNALAAFQPKPSLHRSLGFCIESMREFHNELCSICDKSILPADPNDLELDDTKDAYIERVYCGHLFHQCCLRSYLQQPPFPKGGKLCPANSVRGPNKETKHTKGNNKEITCDERLAHDRWVIDIKVAESRWAQKQARARELDEVADFLK